MKKVFRNVIPQSVLEGLRKLEASVDNTKMADNTKKTLLEYSPIQVEKSSLFEIRDKDRGLYNPYDEKYKGLKSGLVMAALFEHVPGMFEVIDKLISDLFGTVNNDTHIHMGNFFRISRYTEGQHVRIHVDDYDEFNMGFLMVFDDNFSGGQFVLDGKDMELKAGDILLFSNGVPHEVLPIIAGMRLAAFGRFRLI